MHEEQTHYLGTASISRILVKDVSIENENNTDFTDSQDFAYKMDYEFTHSISLKQSILRIALVIEVKAHNRSEEYLGVNAKFAIDYFFHVKDLADKWIEKDGDSIKIDKQLTIMLTSISYSTSRGIIFTRCQGTVMSDLILPIMPNNVIENILDSRTY